MIEYVTALFLTSAACVDIIGCRVLTPGEDYRSQTPTQNPNWCVVNQGKVVSGAMLSVKTPLSAQLLMGPGVVPCGDH
jgi:hypothetical protein